MSKKITVERILVTPKMAEELLKLNTHNRPLSATKVTQYGCAMIDKQWNECGDAIMISTAGVLLNGQHRLSAVIETGISQWFIIMRNVPPEAMATIDCGGKRRSVGENLELEGEEGGREKAPIAAWICKLATRRNNPAPHEQRAALDHYREGIEWAAGALTKPKFGAANVRAAFALAYLASPQIAQDLADRMTTGLNCTEGDAAVILRSVVLTFGNEGTAGRLAMTERLLYCIMKAVKGAPVFQARVGPESVDFFVERAEAKLSTARKVAPRVRRATAA